VQEKSIRAVDRVKSPHVDVNTVLNVEEFVEPLEYGDNHRSGLSPEKYLAALREMDFCICPAGWGGNWTQRVIESLCRGSIPILQDRHLYGLDLRDSVNCITVRDHDWYGSVMRALQLPLHKVQEIRRNVLDLRNTLLVPPVASHRFCGQFFGSALGQI
jgi:hypothetical protein